MKMVKLGWSLFSLSLSHTLSLSLCMSLAAYCYSPGYRARNCVAALQRRLQHRNANVQLFALTVSSALFPSSGGDTNYETKQLADGLVSNCGAPLHREICGKAFTQTLVKLVNDRVCCSLALPLSHPLS